LKAAFQMGHAAHIFTGHTIEGDDLFGSDDDSGTFLFLFLFPL